MSIARHLNAVALQEGAGLACASSCLASAQSRIQVDCHPRAPDTNERIKIIVTDVEFRGENPLPDAIRAQLVSEVQQLNLSVTLAEADSGWLSEVENPIRDAIGELGYFRSVLTATSYLGRAESHERRYVVSVEIESGPQYRLGELQVSGATVFRCRPLRDRVLLHRGELFDVPKIRSGSGINWDALSE
jgi:outer membrane protein assembly factor BamA